MGLNEELWTAALFGQIDKIEGLARKGADLNSRNPNDSNKGAIHFAAYQGHATVVDKLVELGADVNLLSGSQSTALHFAAAYGHYTTVSYLLQLGANALAQDEDGATPLTLAKFKGRYSDRVDFVDVVRVLQEAADGRAGPARPREDRTGWRVEVKGQQMI